MKNTHNAEDKRAKAMPLCTVQNGAPQAWIRRRGPMKRAWLEEPRVARFQLPLSETAPPNSVAPSKGLGQTAHKKKNLTYDRNKNRQILCILYLLDYSFVI